MSSFAFDENGGSERIEGKSMGVDTPPLPAVQNQDTDMLRYSTTVFVIAKNTSTQAPVHYFSFIMQSHERQNEEIKDYLVEEQTIHRRQAPLCLPHLVLSGQRVQQHQTCARREHMLHEVQVKGGRVAMLSQIVH